MAGLAGTGVGRLGLALSATKTRNSDWTKSPVKTYILSLPSAQERREFQTQQARNLGLDAVFIDARSPANIPDTFFMAHAFSWERPLKITEVACFMSHHAVWDIIAKGDEPALILEDDAILARHVSALLEWLPGLDHLDHVAYWGAYFVNQVHATWHGLGRRLHFQHVPT